jgi:uncharacterized protein YutD
MIPTHEEMRAALMEARGIIKDYYYALGDWEQAAVRLKHAYEACAPDTPEPLREAIEALLQLLPEPEDW